MSSYRTFEELKQKSKTSFLFFTSQSYRTFEELKHVVSRRLCLKWIRRIVPLRNWNDWLALGGNQSFVRRIVPLRNWNWIHVSSVCSCVCCVVSYLWGIETPRAANVNKSARCLSYRTFEELKPSPVPLILLELILVVSYLWGIETNV